LYSGKHVTAQHRDETKSPTKQSKKWKYVSTHVYLLDALISLNVLVA